MKVYTYYHDISDLGYPTQIMERWKTSWRNRGFTPVILEEKDARAHQDYDEINALVSKFPTVNAPFFERACWLRWLAYQRQTQAGVFTDWDVINYDLWPSDIPQGDLVVLDRNICGTVYATQDGIQSFIQQFKTADRSIRYESGKPHLSDMNLFRDWFQGPRIPYGCLATDQEELTCKLVHFTNGLLPEYHRFNERWKAMDDLSERRDQHRSCVVIVLAHHGVEDTVLRHFPLWQAHGYPVWLVSPTDAPLTIEAGDRQLKVGRSGKIDPVTCDRIMAVFDEFMQSKHNRLAMFEYDSFCLQKELSIGTGLSGILHLNSDPMRFMAPRYVQAPWLLNRLSVQRMISTYRTFTNIKEEGSADRFLSALAHVSGVPIFNSNGVGYDTVVPDNIIHLAAHIIRGGITHIHGIKDEWALKMVLGCYEARKSYVGDKHL